MTNAHSTIAAARRATRRLRQAPKGHAPCRNPTTDGRIPPGLERIVGKCLEKNPGARFQSAGDLAFALEGASVSSGATESVRARILPKGRERVAWLLAGVCALAWMVVAARSALFPSAAQVGSVVQAAIPLNAPLQVDLQESSIALSPDGKRLVYRPRGSGPLYLRALDQREGMPLPGTDDGLTPFFPPDATLSPDGRWVAYTSDESGRPEVYVRPFPGPGGKSQISTKGGLHPVWAPNGRELFFPEGNTLMVVPVSTGATFDAGAARPLFSGAFDFGPTYVRNYDVAPDGQHFVVIENGPDDAPTQLNLVLNWFDELKRLVPSPR